MQPNEPDRVAFARAENAPCHQADLRPPFKDHFRRAEFADVDLTRFLRGA